MMRSPKLDFLHDDTKEHKLLERADAVALLILSALLCMVAWSELL